MTDFDRDDSLAGPRFNEYIYDNVHGTIRCSEIEAQIIAHPIFARLHHISQNSSAYLVWPSMKNQRFEHSVGTMHLAGEMFFNAVSNARDIDVSEFHETFSGLVQKQADCVSKEVLNTCFGGSKTAFDRCVNEAFPMNENRLPQDYCAWMVPSRIDASMRSTYCIIAQAVRVAALLHDVGHPPFSHVCEAALESVYELEIPSDDGREELEEYRHALDAIMGSDSGSEPRQQLHEAIGERLAMLLMYGICNAETANARKAFRYLVFALAIAIMRDEGQFADLHVIIDGTVDVDRLDFVQRDSICSGFGTDAVQYARLVRDARLICVEYGDDDDDGLNDSCTEDESGENQHSFVFAFPMRTLGSVEMFLRKRLDNYCTIIYHHDVIKYGGLLQQVVADLAKQRFFESYGRITDSLSMPHDISGLWFPLGLSDRGSFDESVAFSQWNDAWLVSSLTEEYARLLAAGPLPEEDRRTLNILAEVLFGKKSYYSLIQTGQDCESFRVGFSSYVSSDKPLLLAYSDMERVERIMASSSSASASREGHLLVESLLCLSSWHDDPSVNVLAELDKFYEQLPIKVKSPVWGETLECLDDVVAHAALTVFSEIDDIDCESVDLLVEKSCVKTGLSEGVFLYDDNGSLYDLEDVSFIGTEAQMRVAQMPFYYVFVDFDWRAINPGIRQRVEELLAKWAYLLIVRNLRAICPDMLDAITDGDSILAAEGRERHG